MTGSSAKVEEAQRILRIPLEHRALDLPEVQSVSLEDVVARKAEAAYEVVDRPVVVEDTGLVVESWNGLPGALIRWFLETVGVEGVCRMLAPFPDRRARARTVVANYDGHRLRTYIGEVGGRISDEPRGMGGFGWDSIFVPDGAGQTFAEMLPQEKDHYSMRRIALEALARDLPRP